MATSFDYAKGADLYARLCHTTRAQFQTLPLYDQALVSMHATLTGNSCDIPPDFYARVLISHIELNQANLRLNIDFQTSQVEQLQRYFKMRARSTAAPNKMRNYEDTSRNLLALLDLATERSAQRGSAGSRPCTHGTVPDRPIDDHVHMARLWLQKHKLLAESCATTDSGEEIPNDALRSQCFR